MITDIKRGDLKRLAKEGIDGTQLYYVLDQAADKIRAIYTLFGWNQAKEDMFETGETLIYLVNGCIQGLVDHPERHEYMSSTGGVTVNMYEEDGFDTLSLEVAFNIIS